MAERFRTFRPGPEEGSAAVEFVGLVVVLVVPVLYFVLTLSQVQATVFAAESGAEAAVRVLAREPEATGRAHAQIAMAFEDHGLPAPGDVHLGCSVCSGPERDVEVRIRTAVAWPLIPGWAHLGLIPVEASASAKVDQIVLQ